MLEAVSKIALFALPLMTFSTASFAIALGSAKFPDTNILVAVDSGTADVVPVNKMLKLKIDFSTPADAGGAQPAGLSVADVTFDARMPSHNHGMLTKPVVRAVDAKSFVVEGVKFHMPGAWEMRVTARVGGKSHTVVIPLKL